MATETQNEAERYLTIINEQADIESQSELRGVRPRHVKEVIKGIGDELLHEYESEESRNHSSTTVIQCDGYIVTIHPNHNSQCVSEAIFAEISRDEMWEAVLSSAEKNGFDEQDLDREECVSHYADELRCAVLAVMGQCCEPAVDDALVILDE